MAYGSVFAAAWIVTEWLRSWVFTGYPWPPLSLLFLGGWETPGMAVLLPWVGTYGLSGLVLGLAASIAWGARIDRRLIGVASSATALGAVAVVMHGLPAPTAQESNVSYALVQPRIPQDEINDASKFEDQFGRIVDLTLPGNDTSRLVLWPESAIPDYLEDGYPQRYYDQTTARFRLEASDYRSGPSSTRSPNPADPGVGSPG